MGYLLLLAALLMEKHLREILASRWASCLSASAAHPPPLGPGDFGAERRGVLGPRDGAMLLRLPCASQRFTSCALDAATGLL